MPPPHSTKRCVTLAPSEERKTRCSRIALTVASVIFTSGRRMPSSARRQSAIFSSSGTSTGSRSIGAA